MHSEYIEQRNGGYSAAESGVEARQIYQQRGAVAEFLNYWIKEKLGIRKFRLRGLAKATTEALWGVLTYDIMQWIRLSWKPKLSVAAAI